jgi:hypothetical protein
MLEKKHLRERCHAFMAPLAKGIVETQYPSRRCFSKGFLQSKRKHLFPTPGKTTAIAVTIAIAFFLLRSFFSVPAASDENIYINMARAVHDGLVPYRDFFFAHPPLQLYLFQPVLGLFGANFIAVKIFVAALSAGCALFVYLIGRRMFGAKAGFVSFLLFIAFPGFIIFSNQAMGMFEALFFFLAGFYFLQRNNLLVSAAFFAVAIFTRYLLVLLLPMVIVYMLYGKRNAKRFLMFLVPIIAALAGIAYAFFGSAFIRDTVLYHTQANLSIKAGFAQWIDQYLTFGFFTIFFAAISIYFAVIRKRRDIAVLAAYPLIYDAVVLLLFKAVIYHYFLIGLPFLFIALGAVFIQSRELTLKICIAVIAGLAILANASGIAAYSSNQTGQAFDMIINYTKENTGPGDVIFGEPRTTNYVSFQTGVPVAHNYFDSDSKAINFNGKDRFFDAARADRPKLLIIDNNFNYIDQFGRDYIFIREWNVPGYYAISLYKRTNISAFFGNETI